MSKSTITIELLLRSMRVVRGCCQVYFLDLINLNNCMPKATQLSQPRHYVCINSPLLIIRPLHLGLKSDFRFSLCIICLQLDNYWY